MKLTKKLLATAVVTMAVAGQTGAAVMAKDVAPQGPVTVTSGPCNVDLSDANTGRIYYALTNDRFLGAVAADMTNNGSTITLTGVCLEPGWSYTRQSTTNGVQLRFSYNNERAIDFKFVPGKTDIRNY